MYTIDLFGNFALRRAAAMLLSPAALAAPRPIGEPITSLAELSPLPLTKRQAGLPPCGHEWTDRCTAARPIQCMAGTRFGECSERVFVANECTQQCTHLVQEFIAATNLSAWGDYWAMAGQHSLKAEAWAAARPTRQAARGGRLLVGGDGYFPETVMVTVSTSSRDQEHFQETMATLDANHVGGGASIWVLDGVKPELWVDGGGHRDDVFALMEAHLTPLWDKGNTKLPWDKGNASLPADCCRFWPDRLLCAAGPGSPPQDPHHVGASLSHLAAMLTARQRGAPVRDAAAPRHLHLHVLHFHLTTSPPHSSALAAHGVGRRPHQGALGAQAPRRL